MPSLLQKEWEKIVLFDEQNDQMIENLKFQVDSLNMKMENISDEEAHLAKELAAQIDGYSQMNSVCKDFVKC